MKAHPWPGRPSSHWRRPERNSPGPLLLSEMEDYLRIHPWRDETDAALWPGRHPGTRALQFDRPFDHQSFYRWYFKPALKAASLPDIRLHDLRHTAASVWLAAGIQPYKISRWLGHASLATTDTIYSHLYPSDNSDARKAIDQFVARSVG